MVNVKGTASKLEKEILGGIIEPDCPNIEFKNITFDCKSIKDAAGHIFINQTYCNAAPVRHGRWIECASSPHWKCSMCGTKASIWFDEFDEICEWLSDYCPNCGAKMGDE